MDYQEALAWLHATQLTGIKLGLDTIHRLLRSLDVEGPSGKARFLHVAGTNGKGSVCAMIDAVSRAAGKRTGLFTSPHLVSFRERIRIDGEPVSRGTVAAGLTRLRDLTAGWDPAPTFFELATALAALCFAEARVEVIAWETGLGGRLDATNAITPAVSVLTAIDLDHMGYLGGSLEQIAREKAGIIKPGVPVVSGPQKPQVAAVIEATAREREAPLRRVNEPVDASFELALAGSHQRLNAAIALAALEAAGISSNSATARDGLRSVDWPGRFQRLEGGRIILDGAHNPAAAQRLVETWKEEFGPDRRATLILGVLRDKDAAEMCRLFAPLGARIYVVTPASPRALPADELQRVILPFAGDVEVRSETGLADAIRQARTRAEPMLITGSLFLVGEAVALLTFGGEKPEVSWQ